jgi:hypothetical protein
MWCSHLVNTLSQDHDLLHGTWQNLRQLQLYPADWLVCWLVAPAGDLEVSDIGQD